MNENQTRGGMGCGTVVAIIAAFHVLNTTGSIVNALAAAIIGYAVVLFIGLAIGVLSIVLLVIAKWMGGR